MFLEYQLLCPNYYNQKNDYQTVHENVFYLLILGIFLFDKIIVFKLNYILRVFCIARVLQCVYLCAQILIINY